jgi:hypothetical protein
LFCNLQPQLWGVSFGIVFVVAMAGGGTFETGWAGPLVVFGASMVRAARLHCCVAPPLVHRIGRFWDLGLRRR